MFIRPSLPKKVFFAVIMVAGILFAKNTPPKDMILTTPDGRDIMLRSDSTWVFQDQKKNEIDEDFTVPLNGGRVVLISQDGSWGFVKDEIKREKELIPTDTIIGKGHSTHADLSVASAQAMKQAMGMATERVRRALKNIKIDPAKVAECVRRVEKTVDKSEEFKKGSGWNVNITTTLDRGSILAVADCAMKKKKEPGDSDTATVKK